MYGLSSIHVAYVLFRYHKHINFVFLVWVTGHRKSRMLCLQILRDNSYKNMAWILIYAVVNSLNIFTVIIIIINICFSFELLHFLIYDSRNRFIKKNCIAIKHSRTQLQIHSIHTTLRVFKMKRYILRVCNTRMKVSFASNTLCSIIYVHITHTHILYVLNE